MKPAKHSTMVKTCSTLPSGSNTSKKPPLSTMKESKKTNNPKAKPMAIPVTLSSGILPMKPNKVIQNKSKTFEIHSSALEGISNSATSPNKAINNIFTISKECLDFHSKINQELDEIEDNFDIRLLNIEQQLKTIGMPPNFENKLAALTSDNMKIKSSIQDISDTKISNMQHISAIQLKLSKTSTMADHLEHQISKNNKSSNKQLIAVDKKIAEEISILQTSDK
eukprot:15333251-Ditylum_brightwellii.AAC.1